MPKDAKTAAMERTTLIRRYMKERNLDAFILPSHDEYRSEMPPKGNCRLAALTGFTGSFGVAIVTQDAAFLVTDGRYRLQAREELPMDIYVPVDVSTKRPTQLLAERLPAGAFAGFDPELTSKSEMDAYRAAAPSVQFVPVSPNPVDDVWEDRPPASDAEIFAYPEKYAGESAGTRLAKLAQALEKYEADYVFEPFPEHICRLLNVRGGDAPYTPVAFGRLLVEKTGVAHWFVDMSRVNRELRDALHEAGVKIRPLEECAAALEAIPEKARVLLDPSLTSMKHYNALKHAVVVPSPSPCAMMQAVKTDAEIAAMKEAHRIDGLAMTRFLHWLEKSRKAKEELRETDVVSALTRFRAMSDEYRGDSFAAIVGADANGAVIHYRPSPKTAATIRDGSMVLIDSGGQYLQGTTDVTRTVCLFEPTPEQKRRFTLVLRGHMALARADFPENTAGEMLDALARQYLWREGRDYAHGTGHGVGCFLGVHEGPQRIGKGLSGVGLRPNMVLSNEPGYYRDGAYGIRIESLIVVERSPSLSDEAQYCRFRTITLVPIDARAIDFSLLNVGEKNWLRDYHDRILAAHGEFLSQDERAWLEDLCAVYASEAATMRERSVHHPANF
ncbi:MAG: aminopeptidase P family protein [Rickettsiales bacterium]